jgi:hypothetical protein
MMSRNLLISIAILAVIGLSGCGTPGFDSGAVKGMLESAPLELSNEQVVLSDFQLECGTKNDLWDPPNGNVARLTQKGRDLHFTDDIRLNDPENHQPYTQVSGKFPVQVADVTKVRDTDGGKLADVKLGIVVTHECFTTPLPLMGIRKGKFTPAAPVVFRFKGSDKEFTLDKLMH